MLEKFGVIDLFAGPGGLGEGFSQYRAKQASCPFQILISAEKDPAAHATLRLRAFVRQFGQDLPKEYFAFHAGRASLADLAERYPTQWKAADEEARLLELGTPAAKQEMDAAIRRAKKKYGDRTVVIGGPPCQAYSLVGRARNKGIAGYRPEDDDRHFLFKEYIRVLKSLRPAVFVMENVKGLLSSKVSESSIFELLLEDMRTLDGRHHEYEIVPLGLSDTSRDLLGGHAPSDFIIRSEDYGVPQNRHRVILLGIRKDLFQSAAMQTSLQRLRRRPQSTVEHVLTGMPRLRSGLSGGADAPDTWRDTVAAEMARVIRSLRTGEPQLAKRAEMLKAEFERQNDLPPRSDRASSSFSAECPAELRSWIERPRLKATANHETRGHMPSDLGRYFFAATFATVLGRSPTADEFPRILAPNHANWSTGKFADRFRVQVSTAAATTVTSHISKDGHYFIHPDAIQCRSLTVREAARIQTFPDDYVFMGSRTEQYTQVGNAVPPYLANQIAGVVHGILTAAMPAAASARSPRVA